MDDVERRSRNMSMIKGRDTRPEVAVRSYLFSKGFRFRKNDRRYPGKPDIVLPKYRTVIFVNGCFWHRHQGCRFATVLKSNVGFWQAKFERNQQRDIRDYSQLEAMGWNVIVLWECQLRPKTKADTLLGLECRITGEEYIAGENEPEYGGSL
jgi:DNA mismatch endonuclease, patch repair protein